MESDNLNVKIDFSKEEQDDELEILKLKKDDAHIYKLPPMSSSEGHTTGDFIDLQFRGKMKMTIKGAYCIVYFLNDDGSIFLVSIIDENIDRYIVRCKDSTRYFSIKALNEKMVPSWYGLGK
jgi:hypothetical protein